MMMMMMKLIVEYDYFDGCILIMLENLGRIWSFVGQTNAISKCRSDYRPDLFDQKTPFQNVVLTTEPDFFDQQTPFQNVVRTTEPDLFRPKTRFSKKKKRRRQIH